jgi:hypothetical protein
MNTPIHQRVRDMKKPDFDSSGVFAYGAARLSHEERAALLDLIPRRWKSVGTQDRMHRTDSDRLMHGVSEALAFFDASRARPTAAGGAVRDDILAIGKAAASLQKAIQIADNAARREINSEATAAMFADANNTDPLSTAGEFVVHWFEALKRRGHLDIAFEIEDKARDFDRRAHPILSALWDLSGDVATIANRAARAIRTDTDTRPDRVIPRQFAYGIVGHVTRNLGRKPPASLWFEELVTLAGSYRGVTIGKALTRKAILDNAAWIAARGAS